MDVQGEFRFSKCAKNSERQISRRNSRVQLSVSRSGPAEQKQEGKFRSARLRTYLTDDPQKWNMYAYVRNNPTTLTDPSGLDSDDSIPEQMVVAATTVVGGLVGDTYGAEGGAALGTLAEPGGGTFAGAVAGAGGALGAAIGREAGQDLVHFIKSLKDSGSSKGSDSEAPSTEGKSGDLLGSEGFQIRSRAVLEGSGDLTPRVDVENPAPGKRAGSLHLQVGGEKYEFNLSTGQLELEAKAAPKLIQNYLVNTGQLELEGKAAPKSIQNYLKDPKVQKAIQKGLRYLGEQ